MISPIDQSPRIITELHPPPKQIERPVNDAVLSSQYTTLGAAAVGDPRGAEVTSTAPPAGETTQDQVTDQQADPPNEDEEPAAQTDTPLHEPGEASDAGENTSEAEQPKPAIETTGAGNGSDDGNTPRGNNHGAFGEDDDNPDTGSESPEKTTKKQVIAKQSGHLAADNSIATTETVLERPAADPPINSQDKAVEDTEEPCDPVHSPESGKPEPEDATDEDDRKQSPPEAAATARYEARIGKYGMQAMNTVDYLTHLDIFGPATEVPSNEPNRRYFEYAWPQDPDKAEAATAYLKELTNHISSEILLPTMDAPEEDTIAESIHVAQQQFYDQLVPTMDVGDHEIEKAAIIERFQALRLATCNLLFYNPEQQFENPSWAYSINKHIQKPKDEAWGAYLGLFGIGFVLARQESSIDPARTAAHEAAHASQPETTQVVCMPDGGTYYSVQPLHVLPKSLREGRATLLTAHNSDLWGDLREGSRSYRDQDNSLGAITIPNIYDMRSDSHYTGRPMSQPPKQGKGTIDAVNLELLIAQKPTLLMNMLYGGQSLTGLRQIPREFNAIQPGLYDRFRQSNDLVRDSQKLNSHILRTICGVDTTDTKAVRLHTERASKTTQALFKDLLKKQTAG